MNKIITGSVTLAATAGIGFASMGAASAAVPASSTPVIYRALGSWKHPVVKPGYFALGAHFYLSGMHWSRWSGTAVGHGTDTPGRQSPAPVTRPSGCTTARAAGSSPDQRWCTAGG
jgi:hypothetical protein